MRREDPDQLPEIKVGGAAVKGSCYILTSCLVGSLIFAVFSPVIAYILALAGAAIFLLSIVFFFFVTRNLVSPGQQKIN